jgi:hypothetical protein
LLVALAASACTAGVARITAPVDDYAAYRRARIAPTRLQRLRHARAYLHERPDGAFRDEVRERFDSEDFAALEAAGTDPAELRAYLDAVPDGPRSEAAADLLAELELDRAQRRRDDRRLGAAAAAQERRLEAAARARRELIQRFTRLLGLFAGIRSWNTPTWELDPWLIREWRVRAPQARCAGARCSKALAIDYEIPEEKRLVPRQALFDAVIVLESGNVARVAIGGPELWSRLAEAAEIRPVRPGDALARAEAIARSVQIAEAAIEPALPAARCAEGAVSPVVLVRACDGVRLEMIAAPTGDEDDRVEIAPALPSSTP